MDSEVANIQAAVSGYQSVQGATLRNAAIASAVPYSTVPNLYLTNSFDDPDGAGYYWSGR